MAERSVWDIANEVVPVQHALTRIGMYVPDGAIEGNMKLYCPFQQMHAGDDGSKTFRIYVTNTCNCFFGCGHFTPVKLIMEKEGLDREEAALSLLDDIGYVLPNAESRWEYATTYEPPMDRESLAQALKLFCAGATPEWDARQLDSDVAEALRQCLELLPRVRSKDEARRWLERTKTVMRTTLGVNDEPVR